MFLSFGYRNVRVLDGGLKKWTREGRPTHSGKVTPKPGKFSAKLDPSYVRSQQQVVSNIETRAEQLVDARPKGRFEGSAPEPRPESASGHIPGSRNVPYAGLFDAETGAMKPLDQLRQAFAGAGVDLTKPIVTTCGSGVSALVLTWRSIASACAAARCTTARGRNGVFLTARRSRPDRPERIAPALASRPVDLSWVDRRLRAKQDLDGLSCCCAACSLLQAQAVIAAPMGGAVGLAFPDRVPVFPVGLRARGPGGNDGDGRPAQRGDLG